MKFYWYRKMILGLFIIAGSSLILVACGDPTATSAPTQAPATATTIVSPTTPATTTAVAIQTTAAGATLTPSATVATTVAQAAQPTTSSLSTTLATNATAAATVSATSTTAAPKPVKANDAQASQLVKVMNDLDKLKEYLDAVIEGSPKLADFQKHAGELVAAGPQVKASLTNALAAFSNDPVATARLKEIEANVNNTLAIAQK